MELQIGDKVKFLNNVGGGKVTRLINKKLAHVLTEDGFEMPVMISELIKIDDADFVYSYTAEPQDKPFKPKTKKTEQEPLLEPDFDEPFVFDKKEISEEYSDDINIFFAILPVNSEKPAEGDFELHLINDSNYLMFYNIVIPTDSKSESLKAEILEANTKLLVTTIKNDKLNDYKHLTVQMVFFKHIKYNILPTVQKEISIQPVKFFHANSFTANDFFDEKAVIIPIIEKSLLTHEVNKLSTDVLKKIITDKEIKNEKINQPTVFKKNIKPEDTITIVDLHIHELVENDGELSPKEILDIQMGRFENELESAIDKKIRSIVFIHGVGNGKLKFEIRNRLDTKYRYVKYQDASFKEYGYGATMVILK